MKLKLSFLVFTFLLALPLATMAQDYAASVKISTLGINVEGVRSFGPSLNTRLGLALFSYSHEGGGDGDDYEYTGDLKLLSISALADWFPFKNFFRITGGVLINLNEAELEMIPTETYQIGGDLYTPEKLGKLNAKVDFNKVAPYIGIGFGNPMSGGSGLAFTFDIGTVYQGAPNVDLTATGLIEPSGAPDQEKTLENNLDWFQWYPVISFGLTYKF